MSSDDTVGFTVPSNMWAGGSFNQVFESGSVGVLRGVMLAWREADTFLLNSRLY